MEGGAGGFVSDHYVKLRNNHNHNPPPPVPVPPPLTAIGRFLQAGQSNLMNSDDNIISSSTKGSTILINIPSKSKSKSKLGDYDQKFSSYASSSSSSSLSSCCNIGLEMIKYGSLISLYDEVSCFLPMTTTTTFDKISFATPHPHYHEEEEEEVIFAPGSCSGTRSIMKMKGGGGGLDHRMISSSLIRGKWTDEEDRKLVRLVKQHGVRKWAHVAEQMMGRAGKQCRERWHNHLRPDIKKETWSEEEERMLVEAHRNVGNKWAEIAKLIPGRSENAIKNHWNATKRRQNSRRYLKTKKNQPKNTKFRSSILQDYIRSKITTTTTNANDHNIASTTVNATRGSSFDDPSNKFNIIFPELPNPNFSDEPPSLYITQSSYDDELTFMQTFFGDSKPPITHYSNTNISINDHQSSIHYTKDSKSPLDMMNPIHELNGNSHTPYSSIFNESVYIKDLIKSSLDMKPLGEFPSSSLVSNIESSVHTNLNSSFEENPLAGYSTGNLLHRFDSSSSSSSSVAHDDNSNLLSNQEDSLVNIPDHVYISYLLEGSTTLTNHSSDYGGYYGGTKRDMQVFDSTDQQSIGSGSSSNGEKEMDLVEMVLSSQF